MSSASADVDNASHAKQTIGEENGRFLHVKWALALLFWAFVLWNARFQSIDRGRYAIGFLGFAIIIYILHELSTTDRSRIETGALVASAIVTVGTTVYVMYHYMALITSRTGYAYSYEYVIAVAFVLAVIFLLHRKYGWSFLSVLLLAIAYGAFGEYVPGLFRHSGFTPERLLQILVLDGRGMYGSLNEIVAVDVALFLLFAGLITAYGAFDLIIQLSFKAATIVRSGVAQSAVMASFIIGSINGSAAANAAMTGSFTIPLMKKSGLKPETSAGVESVASSGGQILPPIMGAAAFVMASILGIRYIDVITAGMIPALIFFISVAVAVHYTSILQISPDDLNVDKHIEEKKTGQALILELLRYIVPFVVLVYYLGVAQYTVLTSALITIVATVLTGAGIPIALSLVSSESVTETTKEVCFQTIEGFRYGAKILAPIAIIVAAINGVVDIFETTGVPALLSLSLVDLSGGSMLLTIIITMLVCIVLGLGMPTVAAYTLVALLIAPTLTTNFLVPDLAVHYFVFYAAILSGLTPPIAIAVVVASGVAESNFWLSCKEALKIAAPLYVLPVTFIYRPELVVNPFSTSTVFAFVVTLVGALSIVHGLNYPERIRGSRRLNAGIRIVYFTLGVIVMAHPNRTVALLVGGLFVALFIVQTKVVSREELLKASSG